LRIQEYLIDDASNSPDSFSIMWAKDAFVKDERSGALMKQKVSGPITDEQVVAARVVLELWSGAVAPRPADAGVCTRCEVRDVCRRPAAMPIEDLDTEGEGAGA